ncbi:MAG: hypothetical protein ACJ8LG_16550 [Massilia sp.]
MHTGAPVFPLQIMSIAVSAVVGPSRRLRVLVAAYGLANGAAAVAVGLLLPGRFALAPLAAAFFTCAAGCLLHRFATLTKTRRIDISGVGQVRLTVQQDMATSDAAAMFASGAPLPAPDAGAVAVLLPESTLWPHMLLLRLRSQAGEVTQLPVLPDSVAPGVFRALAVAAGAIGSRNKQLQGKRKIL